MRKELERFGVQSEDGQIRVLIKYGTVVPTRRVAGSQGELIGGWTFELEDGSEVSATNDPNRFKVVLTDEVLRKLA